MFLPRLANASTFMPPQGTQTAAQVDALYGFLLWASLVSFIIIIAGMVYFVFKYKRKTDTDKTAYITHNTFLEFLWSFIPFVLFMGVFAWGTYIYYVNMRTVPENALEVHVFAKKWEWKFLYKNGREIKNSYSADNKLVPATAVVPVGQPIRFIMTSQEDLLPNGKQAANPVLHSFFIPAFRIKQDVVPGRYSHIIFTPEKVGEFQVFCTEYCGAQHSLMLAKVKVVPRAEFDAFLSQEEVVEDAAGLSLADMGKKLYQNKACATCHSLDGAKSVGPTYKGLWGSKREFEDGGSATADENYIRESILNPTAHTVKGYPAGQMPVFAGQLTDDQINQLIEFIKTLK